MNFFPNNIDPNQIPIPFPNNYDMNINNQNLFYKINELENKIRKLEQRISRLENTSNNEEDYPPDNSLYMI